MNSFVVALSLLYLNTGAQAVEDNSDAKVHFVGLNHEPPFDSFSGYLNATIKGREQYFFYLLTKSQTSTAARDPLILWLNGGPGCSSLLGMFTELGPFRQTKDGSHLWENMYAWNKVGHVLYLESPGGVGFSYRADGNADKNDDDKTADANYMALLDFLKQYPEFEGRDFYITGESYAGVYLPYLAERIINGTEAKEFKAKFRHFSIFQLPLIQRKRLPSFSQSNRFNQYQDCYGSPAAHDDVDARSNWPTHRRTAKDDASAPILNYDSTDPFGGYPCWKNGAVMKYLTNPDVVTSIHVSEHSRQPWTICNNEVSQSYSVSNDVSKTVKYVVEHSDAKLLIYAGDLDWACSFLGIEWFVRDLAESSKLNVGLLEQQITKSRAPWDYRGVTAGFVETYGSRIDLLTVKGAGHMVPTDRPGPALQMIANFIGNTDDYSRPYVFTPAIRKTTKQRSRQQRLLKT